MIHTVNDITKAYERFPGDLKMVCKQQKVKTLFDEHFKADGYEHHDP